jgi:hypothetical protein
MVFLLTYNVEEHAADACGTLDIDMSFPDGLAGHVVKYQASKIAAHKASIDFMESEKPKFLLVTIHPVFVLGNSLIQQSAGEIDGMNAWFWGSLQSGGPPFPSTCVHVLDVADAHVNALTISETQKVSSFLLAGPAFEWSDVADFVKKNYRQIDVKLKAAVVPFMANASHAEDVLGLKWRTMEQQIRDIVDQQLFLASN